MPPFRTSAKKLTRRSPLRLRANGRNNSQHCWRNNVGSCCARLHATLAVNVALVVACVLAVVCKRMQQLPTSLGPAVHRGKNTTHKSTTLEELCKRIQHCCATRRRSRNNRNVGSCWLKSLTGTAEGEGLVGL